MKNNRFKFKKFIFFVSIFVTILSTNAQQLPIRPTRTISFTTDEGSYMNIDVSPDGKTLLFDLLGDLYSVSANGGQATQLTKGIALNLRPVWSPNGKRIAYISDMSGSFQVNVMDLKGSFHKVLSKLDDGVGYGQNAIWSNNGNYIALGNFVYGLAGGGILERDATLSPIRYSQDGNLVYYVDSGKLYYYNYTTNSKATVASIPTAFMNTALSPDGHWWAYIRDTGKANSLVVLNLLDNSERILISSLIKDSSIGRSLSPTPHFSFSSDSKAIFIGYRGKIHRIDIETKFDQIIPFSAKVKAELGPYNYNTFHVSHDSIKIKYTRSASESPDGKHLVFSALDQLYIKDLPKGKAQPLVSQSMGQFQPVYSPDGHWIAYVSWCDTTGGYVWRVPASGGRPEKLAAISAQYQRPTWSPDGTRIAVVVGPPKLGGRDDHGSGELEIISVNGAPVRIIDDKVPLWNQLAFSNDGNRIIYQPGYEINNINNLVPELVSRNKDGGDLRILLSKKADYTDLQQINISPDFNYIVYTAAEDLYLIPIDKFRESQILYERGKRISMIKFARGVDPHWEKEGKMLTWTYGNKFYKVRTEKIIGAAVKNSEEKSVALSGNRYYVTAPVKPDQVITLDITVPSFYAHGLIAIKNVRIIPMQGKKVIEHGTIIIKDGRFVAVGETATNHIPLEAKIFDLAGATVMPGLIDVHLHMRVPPDVFPQQSWMFLANLAYGVTTARDPSLSFDSFGYKELLESGQMIGPRLYSVGRAIRIPDGVISCDNIEDARAVVHKRAELGATVVKQYFLPSRIQRQWLQIACREAGLNMTNEGAFEPIVQLGMIKDGSTGVEHNPIWGDVYKDVISFIAASGTDLTPALQHCYGVEYTAEYFKYKYWNQPDKKRMRFSQDAVGHIPPPRDTITPGFVGFSKIDASIRRQGGRVTLGSHGDDEGIGPQNELWALQMGGLSNLEALQAATIMGAEALGIQKDIGSIEVGKIADLLILNKNPLEDIHNSREIRYVMKDGILYDGNNLDMIWPTFKKCPEWRLNEKP